MSLKYPSMDPKPATPPAADVVAQIRERDEMAQRFGPADDTMLRYAQADRHALLSLLAARDAEIAQLKVERDGWRTDADKFVAETQRLVAVNDNERNHNATVRSRVAALESALRDAMETLRGYTPEKAHDGSCVLGVTDCDGSCMDRYHHDGMLERYRALLTGSTPERRVADEPWRIPARVGALVHLHNEGAWGTWEWQSDQVLFSPDAWRRLMGRRKSDWSTP